MWADPSVNATWIDKWWLVVLLNPSSLALRVPLLLFVFNAHIGTIYFSTEDPEIICAYI